MIILKYLYLVFALFTLRRYFKRLLLLCFFKEIVLLSKMVFRCSLPGCNNKTTPEMPMHSLPKNFELRQKWCEAIHRIDLIGVSDTQRHNFRICDAHFTADVKFQRNRKRSNLKYNAVPSLHLEESSSNGEGREHTPDENELEIADPLSILNGASNNIEIVIEDDDDHSEEVQASEMIPKIDKIFSLCDASQEEQAEHLIGNVKLVDIQSLKMKSESAVSNNDSSIEEKNENECFVHGCKSTSETQIMFPVPADPHIMQLWDLCIAYNNGNTNHLTKQTLICQKHFHKDDFIINKKNTELCAHAIPCIPYSESCTVAKCPNRNIRMFPFPVLNKKLLNCWINALKYKPLEHLPIMELVKHRICIRHFPPNLISANGNMHADAVPQYFITTFSNDLMSHKKKCIYLDCFNNDKNAKVFMAKVPIDSNYERLKTLLTRSKRILIDASTIEYIYARIDILNYGLCTHHYSVYQSQYRIVHQPADQPENFVSTFQKKVNSKPMCFYRNCQYPISSENPLYTFPQQKDKYQLWWAACGWEIQDNEKPPELNTNERPQICSKHFEPHMIKLDGRLLENAIPIKFVPSAVANTVKNHEAIMEKNINLTSFDNENCIKPNKKTLKLLRCAVKNCDSLSQNYKFPNPQREQDRFQIWYRFCNNSALKNVSRKMILENFVICSRHFESVFHVGTLQLTPDAIPTLAGSETGGKISNFENYRTKVNYYLNQLTNRQDMQSVTSWADTRYPVAMGKRKHCCVFERDRLAFPGYGKYLKIKRKDNSMKLPFIVYKYRNSSDTPQRVSDDVNLGESMTVHSVIIIDDNDECERRILNQRWILDQLNIRKK